MPRHDADDLDIDDLLSRLQSDPEYLDSVYNQKYKLLLDDDTSKKKLPAVGPRLDINKRFLGNLLRGTDSHNRRLLENENKARREALGQPPKVRDSGSSSDSRRKREDNDHNDSRTKQSRSLKRRHGDNEDKNDKDRDKKRHRADSDLVSDEDTTSKHRHHHRHRHHRHSSREQKSISGHHSKLDQKTSNSKGSTGNTHSSKTRHHR